jgi:Tfp pilus tip-associated adhesin PilY1
MGKTLPNYPAIIRPSTTTKEMLLLATLKDKDARIQPITARPAGTPMPTHDKRVYYVGTGRYLGDGTHGGLSDLSDPGLSSGIAWQQSIYGIIDRLDIDPNGYGDIRQTQGTKLVKQDLSPISPTVRQITKNPVDWTSDVGFVIDLNPPSDPTPGERVVLDVRLVFGTLIITSTIPVAGGCTGGGTSIQYNLDYKTGGYVGNSTTFAAGWNLGQLIVGTAVTQTSEGSIKALNKSLSGENTPASVQISDVPTTLRRFSYRER